MFRNVSVRLEILEPWESKDMWLQGGAQPVVLCFLGAAVFLSIIGELSLEEPS